MAETPETDAALPGMEDHSIKALDDAGREYARIRDARMKLTKDEKNLKERTMGLMDEHELTHYKHDDVDIEVQPPDGKRKIKVRVGKTNGETNGETEDDDDEA